MAEIKREELEKLANAPIEFKLEKSFELYVARRQNRFKVMTFWKVFINGREIFKGRFTDAVFHFMSFKKTYERIRVQA